MKISFKQFLKEMTMPGGAHPEHNKEDLTKTAAYLLTGKKQGEVESGKFFIYLTDKKYLSLFTKDGELIGWLEFSKDVKDLSLEKIYVLPEHRKQKAGKILLFWLKSRFKKSIKIDGVVFKDSENFINSLEDDGRFSLKLFNKRDKTFSDFSRSYQKSMDLAVIVEEQYREFLQPEKLPGLNKLISYSYFN